MGRRGPVPTYVSRKAKNAARRLRYHQQKQGVAILSSKRQRFNQEAEKIHTQQADQARAPIPDTYLPRAPSYCAPKDPGGTLTSELQQEHSSDVLLVSDDEDFTVDDGPTIVDDGDTGQQREEEAEIHISTNTDPAEYVLRTGGQPSRSATFISKHGWGSSNLLEISTDSDTDVIRSIKASSGGP
ncbi:hypothetical protein N7494_005335 [Penicillium frequentans]|uniref:Uncharacterized protein n=1 Tax=Penicillium frequentans TaxID=3151616 RepID=A0AAD6CXS0_9EURO|nr:hypothetical protein N7494_005335 [Penicillium glabrum]